MPREFQKLCRENAVSCGFGRDDQPFEVSFDDAGSGYPPLLQESIERLKESAEVGQVLFECRRVQKGQNLK